MSTSLSENTRGAISGWIAAGLGLSVWALLLLTGVLVASLSQGHFSYSLDDPYIHLAMAEEILRGGYGVNSGEPAAAASSIAFPFLLSGLLALGFDQWASLAINAVATLAAIWLAVAAWAETGVAPPRGLFDRSFITIAVGIAATNLIGVAFTGLEHSLHLALTLACFLGAVRLARRQKADLWWLACLLVQLLVRYEGLGVAFAGAVVLGLSGRWRLGGAIFVGAAGELIAFGAWLVAHGLPPLPSSVIVKSGDIGGGGAGALVGVARGALHNLTDPYGVALAALCVAFAMAARRAEPALDERAGQAPAGWTKAQRRLVAAFPLIVVVGQLAVGQVGGWQFRYSLYAMVLALAALPVVFPVRVAAVRRIDLGVYGLAGLVTALAMSPLARGSFETPLADRAIALQQREMHRLAVDFVKAPVAVNDLGWVSWRNPNYVLDLWGLASEEARQARSKDKTGAWIGPLAAKNHVELIMIYDGWFPTKPKEWVYLGVLDVNARRFGAAASRVTLYAASDAAAIRLRPAVRAWAASLPKRDRFLWADVHPAASLPPVAQE